VVTVNSVLLLLIDLAAEWERHASKALFQKIIFTRCVFYLTMNMLIIPALSFLAVTNLYQLLIDNTTNLFTIIQAIYFVLDQIIYFSLAMASFSQLLSSKALAFQ
jgi:hypothetical protein